MPPKKDVVASFDQMIQDNRKERNAKLAQEMLGTDPKKLAQEMLGKNRRSQTPRAQPAPASLASRVGVNKRSNSVPRPNTAPPRNPRLPGNANPNARPKPVTTASSGPAIRSNGHSAPHKSASEINIRGAASGAYIVRASNFAPGTTAADIESVMSSVGGMLNYCKLVAQAPTVIAEMEFVDKVGAEAVIQTFNNKKADGRMLYVYFVKDGGAVTANAQPAVPVEPEVVAEDTMEVDENALERQEQDRIRAERRGRDDQVTREAFPSGPRDNRRFDNRRHEGDYGRDQYQDGRQGYSGGRGGYGRGGGGGYGRGGPGNGGRMYSDGMRRGGGQSYRP